jgi:hypothetical protein
MSKNTKIDDNDFRENLPHFTPEAMEKNQTLVDLLKRIAAKKKGTPDLPSGDQRHAATDCGRGD